MALETWFPTVVFYEDLQLDPEVKQRVLEAVRERAGPELVSEEGYLTANNVINDLHLDPRLSPLFEMFRAQLEHFFFEVMLFDRRRVDFYVGRCWPVVQVANGYEGQLHHHGGAAFSGLFYLQVPEGSGALEFYKPVESPYDSLPKTGSSGLTYRTAVYQPVENRLMLFSADLKHKRLANTKPSTVERIAISFDVYSMADIGAFSAGLPRSEFLKKIV